MAVPPARAAVVAAPCPDMTQSPAVLVSIVVPVLNEAAGIEDFLVRLQAIREQGAEVILVDGGSVDDTLVRAQNRADRVISAPRGRAAQMNAGAAIAAGELLIFLHADTCLPPTIEFSGLYRQLQQGSGWGFCAVRLSGRSPMFRLIERMMNWRSRLTGIGTGDQVLLVLADIFRRAGGFPTIPLMEDIAFSKILNRQCGRPLHPDIAVVTSSRRWEQRGVMRTVVLMWRLRLLFWLGVSPAKLRDRYYR